MNKKLGRLADPTMGLYFGVLAAFAVASFLLDQPILAAAEAGAGGLLFLFYRLRKNHRSKELAHTPVDHQHAGVGVQGGNGRCPWP